MGMPTGDRLQCHPPNVEKHLSKAEITRKFNGAYLENSPVQALRQERHHDFWIEFFHIGALRNVFADMNKARKNIFCMLLAIGAFLWVVVDESVEGTDEGAGEEPPVWIPRELGNIGVLGVLRILEEKEDCKVAAKFKLFATNAHSPFEIGIGALETFVQVEGIFLEG